MKDLPLWVRKGAGGKKEVGCCTTAGACASDALTQCNIKESENTRGCMWGAWLRMRHLPGAACWRGCSALRVAQALRRRCPHLPRAPAHCDDGYGRGGGAQHTECRGAQHKAPAVKAHELQRPALRRALVPQVCTVCWHGCGSGACSCACRRRCRPQRQGKHACAAAALRLLRSGNRCCQNPAIPGADSANYRAYTYRTVSLPAI